MVNGTTLAIRRSLVVRLSSESVWDLSNRRRRLKTTVSATTLHVT